MLWIASNKMIKNFLQGKIDSRSLTVVEKRCVRLCVGKWSENRWVSLGSNIAFQMYLENEIKFMRGAAPKLWLKETFQKMHQTELPPEVALEAPDIIRLHGYSCQERLIKILLWETGARLFFGWFIWGLNESERVSAWPITARGRKENLSASQIFNFKKSPELS